MFYPTLKEANVPLYSVRLGDHDDYTISVAAGISREDAVAQVLDLHGPRGGELDASTLLRVFQEADSNGSAVLGVMRPGLNPLHHVPAFKITVTALREPDYWDGPDAWDAYDAAVRGEVS